LRPQNFPLEKKDDTLVGVDFVVVIIFFIFIVFIVVFVVVFIGAGRSHELLQTDHKFR
jgi:uncharacterized membrane protein